MDLKKVFNRELFENYLDSIPEKYLWYNTGGFTHHLIKPSMFKIHMPDSTKEIVSDENCFSIMPDKMINAEFFTLVTYGEFIMRICIGDLVGW